MHAQIDKARHPCAAHLKLDQTIQFRLIYLKVNLSKLYSSGYLVRMLHLPAPERLFCCPLCVGFLISGVPRA